MGRIVLYNTKSDSRKLNKSLTTIKETDVVIKDDNNVLHPSIVVEYFSGWRNVNYIYIEEFNRYYFVKPRVKLGRGILLNCDVDVLMSFNSSIKSMGAIVNRSSNQGNAYLIDNKIKTTNKADISMVQFSGSFANNLHYVLIVCG